VIKIIGKIFLAALLLIFLFLNISVWINVGSPVNVIFTVPKMLYPNIVLPIFIVLLITVILWSILLVWKKKPSTGLFMKIVFVTLLFLTVNSGILIRMIMASDSTLPKTTLQKMAYSGRITELTGANFDLKQQEDITNLKLFIPEESLRKEILFLYLPYGHWSVHADLSIFSHLKETLLKNGYSFGFLSCSGSETSDIFKIVSEIKSGIKLVSEDNRLPFKKIILSGSSAGGHLALLSACSENIPAYDLYRTDATVDGVVAFCPAVNLFDAYEKYVYNAGEAWYDRIGDAIYSTQDGFDTLKESHMAIMEKITGGTPEGKRENYELASVDYIVHEGVPPILLIQGTDDSMTPYTSTERLYEILISKGLTADLISLNSTDHVFDTFFPTISIPTKIAYNGTLTWLAENN